MIQAARHRLGFVAGSLNPGGTERLAIEMALALADEFEVSVVCLDEPGTWASRLRRAGIPVNSMWRQPGLDVAMPVKLARYFRQSGVELVHAHQCTPWFYAALSRLLYRKPRLLLEEHGRFFPEQLNRLRKAVNVAAIAPLTHRFVAVSEDVRRRLAAYEGLDYEKILVIHNGTAPVPVLDGLEREVARRELGFEPKDFVIGTVGRLDSIKNLPMLVSSLAGASASEPHVRGLLVGDGPALGEVTGLVDSLGMNARVVMTGFRDDARRLVQCMDMFVLSSFSEGISMALLEAMAAGVPVAVTAVGGNIEVVVDGESGWVVPSGSVDRLSAAILECVRDSGMRRALAEGGRKRFAEHFTFERMLERYKALYRDLLAMSP